MSFFKRIFHPNRVKREVEQESYKNVLQVQLQASQQLESSRLQREQELSTISVLVRDARVSINTWYQRELNDAQNKYSTELYNYKKVLWSFDQALRRINNPGELDYNQFLLQHIKTKFCAYQSEHYSVVESINSHMSLRLDELSAKESSARVQAESAHQEVIASVGIELNRTLKEISENLDLRLQQIFMPD